MARYNCAHQTAAGSTLSLLMLVNPGTAVRAALYSLTLGSDATPADLAGEFTVQRGTVSGTGTALTENTRDTLTVAATIACEGGTFTGSTVTANTYQKMIPLNQRATYEWNANPGDEIYGRAVADDVIVVYSVAHGGTPNMNVSVAWWE